MIKRLPYLALAVLLAVSTCVLMGGKVRAASPIFYDGTVQWNIGRRTTTNIEDFNYSSMEYSIPMYGTEARIISALGGIPSNANTTTTFDNLPSFVTVNSPDLCTNGGYLYVCFLYAYSKGHSINSNPTFTPDNAVVKKYNGGSPEYAASYGRTQSYTSYTHQGRTTVEHLEIPTNYNPMNIVATGFSTYNGYNFPKTVYFLQGNQFGTDNNISTFYVYGDTATNWYKLQFCFYKISVDTYTGSNGSYQSIFVIMNDVFQGTFKSTNANIELTNTYTQDSAIVQVPSSDIVYLCPIYCYATSSNNYEEIEAYLASINSNLSLLVGGQQVSQSVLESYAALGSEARQAAEDAVRAMSAAAPTFQASDYDVFDNVDSVAMQQFSSIVGFLSLRRILPILLAALALVTIGYLFFGKK